MLSDASGRVIEKGASVADAVNALICQPEGPSSTCG